MTWIPLFAASDVGPGRCKAADADGEDVLIVNVDGTLHAVSNICSHEYAELDEGEIDGNEVICPLHGARFDVATGEALSPPAYEPIATYPLRVVDGIVEVEIEIED